MGDHFDERELYQLISHATAANTDYASSVTRRAVGRSHRLLASAGRGQHFVKCCFCAELCEQRIVEQIGVRAIVLIDCTLKQMESCLLFPAEREDRALVI